MAPEMADVGGTVIFIVDDDEGVRSSLKLLVRSLGLSYAAFSSGEEFLASYDGREEGCVLLDVRMPGMSGVEVTQRLDDMSSKIPVIFLTAQGEEDIPARAAAIERIQKPFRGEELVSRIRELSGSSSADGASAGE